MVDGGGAHAQEEEEEGGGGTVLICDDHLLTSGVNLDLCATLMRIVSFLRDDSGVLPPGGPMEKNLVGARAHLKPIKHQLQREDFMVTEIDAKRGSYRRWLEKEGITGDVVEVRVPAGLESYVSWLLMTRPQQTGARCVVLVGRSKDYLYPLSRLVERGLTVVVVEPETTAKTSEECRGFMSHRLIVTVDGRLQDWVEEVPPPRSSFPASPMHSIRRGVETVAVLDGTYLLKMTSPEFAGELVNFLPTYPIYQGMGLPPIDLTFFVDSSSSRQPEGIRKCLAHTNYNMVMAPWNSLKKEWAPYYEDARRQVHSHTGQVVGVSGGTHVKVLMQAGVDSTIAALLVELGEIDTIRTIILCSGDQDFTNVVRSIRRDYDKEIVVLSSGYRSSRDLRDQAHLHINLWDIGREFGFRRLVEEERRNPPSYCEGRVEQRIKEFRQEILRWTSEQVLDDNLFKRDPRIRPVIPLTFEDEVEYFLTLEGYSIEDIRSYACKNMDMAGTAALTRLQAFNVQVMESRQEVSFRVDFESDRGLFVSGQVLLISPEHALGRSVQQGVILYIKKIPFIKEVESEQDGKLSYQAEIISWIDPRNASLIRGSHARITILGSGLLDERLIRATSRRSLPTNFASVILKGSQSSHVQGRSCDGDKPIEEPQYLELNPSQQQACRAIAGSSRPIELLHGPPGTGKTRTVVVALMELMKRKERVLVSAPTNVAVQHLIEQFLAMCPGREQQLVLIGDDRRMDNPPSILLETRSQAEATSKEAIISTALVVFCTVASAARPDVCNSANRFDLAIIDEAAQVPEVETLLVLQRGIKRLVLVGDPRQLPGMVYSPMCKDAGSARSLMERLMDTSMEAHLLDIQYRMGPEICHFPNKHFYHGALKPGLPDEMFVASWHSLDPESHKSSFPPFVFFDHRGSERQGEGNSWVNRTSTMVVKELLCALKDRMADDYDPKVVGIITPYTAQVAHLSESLGNLANGIDIKTIDGFQGQEKDIIIFIPTRSNEDGLLGFLDSPNRTNVALTRAKRSLWIVGDARTLHSGSAAWQALVEHCEELGLCWSLHNALSPDLPVWFQKGGKKILTDLLVTELKGLLAERARHRLQAFFSRTPWPTRFSLEASKALVSLVTKAPDRQFSQRILNVVLLDVIGSWSVGRCFSQLEARGGAEASLILKRPVSIERTKVVVMASVVLDSQRLSQVLQIWDVVDASQVPTVEDRINTFFDRVPPAYRDRCRTMEWSNRPGCPGEQRRKPCSWADGVEMAAQVTLEVDQNGGVSQELGVTSAWVNEALRGQALRVTPTDTQEKLIQARNTIIVCGRSGTGKTLVLLYRLVREQQDLERAIGGVRHLIDSSGEQAARTIRHIFLTLSPQLCLHVKKEYQKLTNPYGMKGKDDRGGDYEDIRLEGGEEPGGDQDEDDDDDQNEDGLGVEGLQDEKERAAQLKRGLPDSYLEMEDKHFPAFITYVTLLELLDRCLQQPFFTEDRTKARMVTGDVFSRAYWPRFSDGDRQKFNDIDIWTEITSNIKGKGCQALSKEDYCKMSQSSSAVYSMEEHEDIYKMYQRYQQLKQEQHGWDLGDAVAHIDTELEANRLLGGRPLPICHRIYVDEVQDLTEAQISLLRHLNTDIVEGYAFAGDTAQCITLGLKFRFQALKDFLYAELMRQGHAKSKPPAVTVLDLNKRTHQKVLAVANTCIQVLRGLFPGELDAMVEERAELEPEAPLPVLVEHSYTASGSVVHQFGSSANQCIIVRNEAAKRRLLDQVRFMGIIYTIHESKGLEAKDVLLYDFFADSLPNSKTKNEWRGLIRYLNEIFPGREEECPPVISKQLPSELRAMYVGLSRARVNLWIYDSNPGAHYAYFELLKLLGLVRVVGSPDDEKEAAESLAKQSSKLAWKRKGIKLYNQDLFDQALRCFERSGDEDFISRTKASLAEREADALKVMGQFHSAGLKYEEAYRLSLGPKDYARSAKYGQDAAWCFERVKRPDTWDRAAGLYRELGEYGNAGLCFRKAGKYIDSADAFCLAGNYDEALKSAYSGRLLDYAMLTIFPHVSDLQRDRFCKDMLNVVPDNLESTLPILRRMSFDGLGKVKEPRFQLAVSHIYEEKGDFKEAAVRAERAGDLLRAWDLYVQGQDYSGIFRLKMNEVRAYMVKAMDQVVTAASLGGAELGLKESVDGQALVAKCMTEVEKAGELIVDCMKPGIDMSILEPLQQELRLYQKIVSAVVAGVEKGTEVLCKMILPTHQKCFVLRFLLLLLRYQAGNTTLTELARLRLLVVSRLAQVALEMVTGVLGFWTAQAQVKDRGYAEAEKYFTMISCSSGTSVVLAPDKANELLRQTYGLASETLQILVGSRVMESVSEMRLNLYRPKRFEDARDKTTRTAEYLRRLLDEMGLRHKTWNLTESADKMLAFLTSHGLEVERGSLVNTQEMREEQVTLLERCERAVLDLLSPASRDNLDILAVIKSDRASGEVTEALTLALQRRRALPTLSLDDIVWLLIVYSFLGMPISNHPSGADGSPDLWYAFQWQDEVSEAPTVKERQEACETLVRFGIKAGTEALEYASRTWELTRKMCETTYSPWAFITLMECLVTTGICGYAQEIFPFLPRSYVCTYMRGRDNLYSVVMLEDKADKRFMAGYRASLNRFLDTLHQMCKTENFLTAWLQKFLPDDAQQQSCVVLRLHIVGLVVVGNLGMGGSAVKRKDLGPCLMMLQQNTEALVKHWVGKATSAKWITYSQRFSTRMNDLAKSNSESGRHALFELLQAIDDPLWILAYPGGHCSTALQLYPQKHMYKKRSQQEGGGASYIFAFDGILGLVEQQQQQQAGGKGGAGSSQKTSAPRSRAMGAGVEEANKTEVVHQHNEIKPPPMKGEDEERDKEGAPVGQMPVGALQEIEAVDLFRLEAEAVWPSESDPQAPQEYADYTSIYFDVGVPLRAKVTQHEHQLRALSGLNQEILDRLVEESEGIFADSELLVLRADELADELIEIGEKLSPLVCLRDLTAVHELMAAIGNWEERVEEGLSAFENAIRCVGRKERKQADANRRRLDPVGADGGPGGGGGRKKGKRHGGKGVGIGSVWKKKN